MKPSNSSQSMDPTPFEQVDGELVHSDIADAGDTRDMVNIGDRSNSPETALDVIIERNLKENADLDLASDAIDHERLYTDSFIRANENASRVLFLSFLGTALIGTAIFAWFIVSQPNETQEPTPTPGLTVPPNAVPNLNPEVFPGSNPPGFNAPFPPGTSPSDSSTQPPLFPVNPVNPNPANPNPANPNPANPNPANPNPANPNPANPNPANPNSANPNPTNSDQAPGLAGSPSNGNNSTPLIPEGTVPPPPPLEISPDSGTATP